jgi:hypothetical protein
VSYSLDLPADLIASMRDTARDASISAARTFGLGGSTWDYAEPAGTGTGPKVLTSVGTVQALAFRQRPGSLAAAAGGTPVLADVWRLIILDVTLSPGRVIISQTDSDYRFGIASVEPWYEYRRAELERARGPFTVISATRNGGYSSPLWILGIGAT